MFDLLRHPLPLSLLVLALTGCGSFNDASNRVVTMVSPYKSDVVQGNVLTREQLAEVKVGMTREAVRDILGTALLTSLFHADRWDYVFTLKRQGVASQLRRVSLFFKGDVLDRSQSDDLPSETEFVATLQVRPPNPGARPVLEASEEALMRFPIVVKKVAPAPVGGKAALDYPPLEASAR